eukprot:gb/GECG01008350.1/.p1 GENE.gb/GECG01008350.1/~~gb/GECG01008350.1/.p1  ORF type:complete len:176 (+),score=27.77 gb/GECG01008350.1/:1-528(+)
MDKELEEKEEWQRHLQCSVFPDVRFGEEVSGFLSSVEKDDVDKSSQMYSIHGDFHTLNDLKQLWDLLMEQRTQYIERENYEGVERCDAFIQEVKSKIHHRIDRVSAWILENRHSVSKEAKEGSDQQELKMSKETQNSDIKLGIWANLKGKAGRYAVHLYRRACFQPIGFFACVAE